MTDPVAPASTPVPDGLDRDEIALRAYALWQGRGCPSGSAEQDWLEAEHQLRRERAARLEATPRFAPAGVDGLDSVFPLTATAVASMPDSTGAAPKRRRRPSASAVSGGVGATKAGAPAPPAAGTRVTRKRPARPDA